MCSTTIELGTRIQYRSILWMLACLFSVSSTCLANQTASDLLLLTVYYGSDYPQHLQTFDDNGIRLHTGARANADNSYQVYVVKGHSVFIESTLSIPVIQQSVVIGGSNLVTQETITYQDLQSGFFAKPTIRGRHVEIEVSPKRERLDRHNGGAIRSTHITTTVAGKLGDWIDIGGEGIRKTTDPGQIGHTTRRPRDGERIWLKVEISAP